MTILKVAITMSNKPVISEVDFIEKFLGIKLKDWQKSLIKKLKQKGEN